MYKELFKESCVFYKLANESQFFNKELKEFFEYEVSNQNITLKFYAKNINESFDCLKIDNSDTKNTEERIDETESKRLIIEDIVKYFDEAQDNFIGLIDELRLIDDLSMPQFLIKSNKLIRNYKNFDYIQNIFSQIYEISNNINNELKDYQFGTPNSFKEFEKLINGVDEVIDLFIEFCKVMKINVNYSAWKQIKQNLEMWCGDTQERFNDFANDPMNDKDINTDVTEYLNDQGEYETDPETREALDPKVLNEYGKEFVKNPNFNDVYEGKFQ